jgi:hypothetical protein
MKHLLATIAVLTAFNVAAFAQQDCSESYDGNGSNAGHVRVYSLE